MIKTSYYQDLTRMNTFGMKVKARCFMEYDSVADLVDIEFSELARPVLHIGGGSNLLFTDDFKGTILHSKIDFIEMLDEEQTEKMKQLASQKGGEMSVSSSPSRVLVSVGAGVIFDDFCSWAAREGLWGVENLSYIPGEVGASAVQNIGAYGVEVKDVVHTVYCYDTVEEEFVSFSMDQCGYGYRDSIFKHPEIKGRYIVTHVVFALSREPMPRLDYGHLAAAVAEAASDEAGMPSPVRIASGSANGPVDLCSEQRAKRGQGAGELDVDSGEVQRITPSLIRKVIIKIRKDKLPEPSVVGSAGSFFKNPVISMDHFRKIEAVVRDEHGPDCKVPHYIIDYSEGGSSAIPTGSDHCQSDRAEEVGASMKPLERQREKSPMVKVPAAWMIEQCGWKGRRSGGAAVWEKQPLVIVNCTGEAYPEEILSLERRIVDSVKRKFGVELYPEVEHV